MAVIFIKPNAAALFAQGVSSTPFVEISGDTLNTELFSEQNNVIFTSVGLGVTHTHQFFTTLDSLNKYINFGPGIHTIRITALVFSDCSSDLVSLKQILPALLAREQDVVKVSFGGVGFSCVLTGASLNVVAEPDTQAELSLDFAVIDTTTNG